jgi:Ribbon-helix-helix domain
VKAGLRAKRKRRLQKAQLSFHPEPEAYRALKELSVRTGVPQQVYLRRGLDWVLTSSDAAAIQDAMRAARQRTQKRIDEFAALASGWTRPTPARRRAARSR